MQATVRVRVNGKVVAEVKHEPGKTTAVQASLAESAGKTVRLTFDGLADDNFGIRAAELVAAP